MLAKADQRRTDMRLAIVAGMILGVSLAVRAALGANATGKVGHAGSAVRVHEPAPWYVAMRDGHKAGMRGNFAAPPSGS
jgi:hypothetical protein